MPSMFGGDSTSKDYAPHMYVGDHFIHNTGKEFTINGVHYYAGKTRDELLVVERWTDQQIERVFTGEEEVPDEIVEAFSSTTFADEQEERKKFEWLVNG